MGRTGIFGGSFNPVHLAHLIIAECVREECHLDTVLFIPAGRPPHKSKADVAADLDRLQMTRLAVADNPHFRVSDLELAMEGPSYTLRTVRLLRASMPREDLVLIMGGDSLVDLPNWWRADELVEEIPLVYVSRPGDGVSEARHSLVECFGRQWYESVVERRVDAPLLEISATDIRRRLRQGSSVRYLVPEAVRRYIEERSLYDR